MWFRKKQTKLMLTDIERGHLVDLIKDRIKQLSYFEIREGQLTMYQDIVKKLG